MPPSPDRDHSHDRDRNDKHDQAERWLDDRARRSGQDSRPAGGMQPEPQIDCIDCGGRCFLLSHAPETGVWEPGDIVAYRCEDCRDRWDLVLPDLDT